MSGADVALSQGRVEQTIVLKRCRIGDTAHDMTVKVSVGYLEKSPNRGTLDLPCHSLARVPLPLLHVNGRERRYLCIPCIVSLMRSCSSYTESPEAEEESETVSAESVTLSALS